MSCLHLLSQTYNTGLLLLWFLHKWVSIIHGVNMAWIQHWVEQRIIQVLELLSVLRLGVAFGRFLRDNHHDTERKPSYNECTMYNQLRISLTFVFILFLCDWRRLSTFCYRLVLGQFRCLLTLAFQSLSLISCQLPTDTFLGYFKLLLDALLKSLVSCF